MALILVVEDEAALSETLAYNLERQGHEVIRAMDGEAAIELARANKPDLILLDVMLPKIDGVEVCRAVRQESNVPIIMLTARDEEVDKIVGLEIGADDYVTKPFSMREVLARIKAQLRRARLTAFETTAVEAPHRALKSGNLVVDLERCEASLAGEVLDLKPREYDLLCYLITNKGFALTRDQILEGVWGWDVAVETRTVDVHMRWLRAKIEDDPSDPKRIVTVRGVGYRFEG